MSSARNYPDRPWVGIGVVVFDPAGRVLLVRRGRPPRAGEWGIPGGAQHLGESVFEAAVREVREETGLTVVPEAVVTVVDSIHRDGQGLVEYHYTLVEVLARGDGTPAAADDAADAIWATPEAVARLVAWDETRRVIALAAEAGAAGLRP